MKLYITVATLLFASSLSFSCRTHSTSHSTHNKSGDSLLSATNLNAGVFKPEEYSPRKGFVPVEKTNTFLSLKQLQTIGILIPNVAYYSRGVPKDIHPGDITYFGHSIRKGVGVDPKRYQQILHRIQSPDYLGLYNPSLYSREKHGVYGLADEDFTQEDFRRNTIDIQTAAKTYRLLKEIGYYWAGSDNKFFVDQILESSSAHGTITSYGQLTELVEHIFYSLLELDATTPQRLAQIYKKNITTIKAMQQSMLELLTAELASTSAYPVWSSKTKLQLQHMDEIHWNRQMVDVMQVEAFAVEKLGIQEAAHSSGPEDGKRLYGNYRSAYESYVSETTLGRYNPKNRDLANLKTHIFFSLIHQYDATTAEEIGQLYGASAQDVNNHKTQIIERMISYIKSS